MMVKEGEKRKKCVERKEKVIKPIKLEMRTFLTESKLIEEGRGWREKKNPFPLAFEQGTSRRKQKSRK